MAALAAQARLVRARTLRKMANNGKDRAPARVSGRGAADFQGVSDSGGTAKSPAAKWARIASKLPRRSAVQRPISR